MSSETAPCELLVLKKDDFNNVLKATIKARWDEIEDAMKSFSYFESWDSFTIRECCILSKIKSYEPNQVILGDGVGKSSQLMVYFVIEGSCALIEHLFVIETVKRGIKKYELYLPEEDEDLINSIINKKLAADLLKEDEIQQYEDTPLNEDEENARLEHTYKTCDLNSIISDTMIERCDHLEEVTEYEEPAYPTIEEIRKVGHKDTVYVQKKINKMDFKNCVENLPTNVKLRFMQVCTFGEKSSFMNNKILEYRRMIALTPVKCILVPCYWLTQHNKGNVWSRVSQFLKWRIPTRNQVFKKYVSNRKWNDYKKKLVNDILRNKKFVNSTTIHDVPYSIRIQSELN